MAEGDEQDRMAYALQRRMRWARVREEAEEREGPWPARRELGAALRDLLDELDRTGAEPEVIRGAAAAVREWTDRLAVPSDEDVYSEAGGIAGMGNFQDRSPIVGLTNPVAPPFAFEVDVEAGLVTARGRYGRRHEGGPGIVHGGLLAATVDELLGMCTIFSGGPGMTGELRVRYLAPTPIGVDLRMEGRMDRTEGRRIWCSCEVYAGDRRTAEADGLFIQVGGAKFAELDEKRRSGG